MRRQSDHQPPTVAPCTLDGTPRQPARRRASAGLWIVQVLLAVLFLFAGGMKLVAPIAMLTRDVALPGTFLRFIGAIEVSGALGLILPSLLRIRPALTPLAAAGLVIVMSGATGATLAMGQVGPALIPLAIGVLAGLIVYGRTRVAPIAGRRTSARSVLGTRHAPAPSLQPAR